MSITRRDTRAGCRAASSTAVLMAVLLTVSASVLPPVHTDATITPSDCAGVTVPRLSGAFVRPDVGPSPDEGRWWGVGDWQGLLDDLRQACMNQVIMQWTAHTWAGPTPPTGTTDPSWPREPQPGCLAADFSGRFVQPLYASSDMTWATNATQSISGTCGARTDRTIDQVGQLLAAAKTSGIKVWLGLQIDEPAWFDAANSDATWLLGPSYPDQVGGQALLSRQIAADLWDHYGPNGSVGDFTDTIAGFYLPFEADNQYFPSGSPQMTAYGDYLRAVSGYLHQLPDGTNLGVMIAPVQHTQIGAPATDPQQQALRGAWTDTLTDWLSRSGVTVVAPQDATGMQTSSPADLGAWAMAARDAIDRLPDGINADGLPVELWSDTEVYSVQGVPDMSLNRILDDMAATNSTGADVHTFVGFSAYNFDNTPGHPNAPLNNIYHSAYLRYLATGNLPVQRIDPPAVLPHSQPATRLTAILPDPDGATIGLRWRVAAPHSVHPDHRQPDSMVWPVTGYQVFRDGQPIIQLPQPFTNHLGPNGFPTPDTVTNAGMLGFSDTNLQPGRTYAYQVAAFDPFGNLSPLTDTVRVTLPLDAGSAASAATGGVDVAVHAPYAITDTVADPAKLTDGSLDPPPIGDHLVLPNGPGADNQGTFPDAATAPTLNDGVVGTANYLDPAWSWQPTKAGAVTITTDLGAPRPVNTVRSAWLQQTSLGIAPPQAVTVDYATNDDPSHATWRRLGDTSSTGLPPNSPNPATPATTTFANPGVGWLTTALPPGATVAARWIRLTITAPTTSQWTLVSEVEVLGAAGTTDYARQNPAGTANPGTAANYARPGSGCPSAAACPTVTIVSSADGGLSARTFGWMRPGLLTDGVTPTSPDGNPQVGRHYVGWCFPVSTDCPTPPRSNPPVRQFAITVDLGANQPIGSLSTSWSQRPQPGIGDVALPGSVSYAYRTATDNTHQDTRWLNAGTASEPLSGNGGVLVNYTVGVPPDKATGSPAVARWIRAVITLPRQPGWLLASAIHIYTPQVVAPGQGQLPLIYATRSTINYGYDAGRPVNSADNNPTTPYPNGAPPALPLDSGGRPIAAACAAAAQATPCKATDPSPVLSTVLTGVNPSTDAPYRGNPSAWWAPGSHWVDLSGAAGYDIVIPTPNAPAALTELRAHFLQDNSGAIGLPATVDYYVTTTPDPTTNPDADSWTWTRRTAQRPNLPPYLPDALWLTWTYTSTVPTTPSPVTAIRIHVNSFRGQHVFIDHAGAYAWQRNN